MERVHRSLYTTICKTVNGNLLYDPGNSSWGSVTTYRGEKWWGGRKVQEGGDIWLIHVDVWQKSNQYCKAYLYF